MIKKTEITPDYICRAVGEIRKIKPDYSLMLDQYEKIFIEQENSKHSITPFDYRIPHEIASVKLKEKFPLVAVSEFMIDNQAAEILFGKICEIMEKAGSEISESVKTIKNTIGNSTLTLEDIFSAFLMDDEASFTVLESDINIDKKILNFIIYNSLKPSLTLFSEKISDYLNDDIEKEWDKGYCPVCGSIPELSLFEDNGKRSLMCSFCGHIWPTKRVCCSFCENTDHETLHYFEIEGEEEYRIDVCDKCKMYIKTVDIRKISRPVYLPLESVSTPYINIKFTEMGYKPGI